MLLQVKKEDIINGLQKAASILPSKSGAAYLRSIWLKAENGKLTIMSTDTNLEFTGIYNAEISEDGLVGINGKNFVDLIHRLPAGNLRLHFNEADNNLSIEQGRRNYRLPVSETTWFQPFATFPEAKTVMWSGDFFKEAIDKTLFCVADETAADGLSCLYIHPVSSVQGAVDICGLNGHQFAVVRITHDELANNLPPEGILIQKKYVTELSRWLSTDDIELSFTNKRVLVRTSKGDESLSLPRAGYSYPDYNAFLTRLEIPEASLLSLPRKETIETLDRISIFNTESNPGASFSLTPNEITLTAQGQETGSANEAIEVEYNGSLPQIVFPTKNMMEIFSHYASATLKLTLTSEEGPCGIVGDEDPGYTVLLMPMKVAQQDYYEEDK